MEAAAALAVEVLGGVGEQRQPPERPDQVELVVDVGVCEELGERGDRVVARPSALHGGPADVLDEVEHVVAGLLAQHVADEPAEQSDVVAGIGVQVGRW